MDTRSLPITSINFKTITIDPRSRRSYGVQHHEPIWYLQNYNIRRLIILMIILIILISSQELPQLLSAQPEQTSETSLPTRSAPASDPWPAWGQVAPFHHHHHHHQAITKFSIIKMLSSLSSFPYHPIIIFITIFIIILFRKEVKRIQLARNDEQCYRYQSLAILPWNIQVIWIVSAIFFALLIF